MRTRWFDSALLTSLGGLARVAAPLAGLLGLVGMLGWAIDAPALTAWIPGRPAMSPLAGAGIVLGAAALHLLAPLDAGRARRCAGRVCAAILLVVASAAVLEYGFAVDLGLDRLLRASLAAMGGHPSGAGGTPLPPPAFPAALCLTLLAAALLVLDTRWGLRGRLAEAFAAGAAVVTHAVLTGHAYHAQVLYRYQPAPALATALALALLAAGILLARPRQGVMATLTSERVGGDVARRLFVPALVGPPLLGFLVLLLSEAPTPSTSLSHALLATASATIAGALTIMTAASLDRVDAVRRKAEDESRCWQEIADFAEDAILATTVAGTVVGWNRAAERLFGWRHDEIVGRSITTIVPEERRPEFVALRQRLGRGERVQSLETLRLHKGGERVEVALSLAPILDHQGRPAGIAAIARDIRERKATERRYADLFQHASDGIFITDGAGVLTEVNAAGCRLLGWARDELVGRPLDVIVSAQDAPRLAAARATLLPGAAEIGDWQLVSRESDLIPVEVSATIRDPNWLLFVRDLRARKTAELALARAHAAERQLRVQLEALAAANAAITDAVARNPNSDLDALLMVVVRQAQALTGARYVACGLGTDPTRPFDPWVQLGMTPEQVAAIGRKPRPVGLLGEVFRHGCPLRLRDVAESDLRVGFPPGHPPMRSFLGVPIVYAGHSHGHLYLGDKQDADQFTADDERALGILATRAAAALEMALMYREEWTAKTWLQGVIDGLPEAVVLVDAAGRISHNKAAARFLAPRDPQAELQPHFDLRDEAGVAVEKSALPLARALQTGHRVGGLELFAHGEGGRVPVLASASPLCDAAGRVMGAVCVLQDISVLKDIERLREQWTAVVAHDLRQPLAVISMSVRTLEHALAAAPGSPVARALARIHGAVARQQRMICDLLDAARIEACQLTIEPAPFDLRTLLAEVAARMQAATARSIELRLAPALPPVLADAGRVEQIMENLLSNAFKYGDPAGEVTIAAHAEERHVVVATTNRGAALAADELSRLFTRFHRARTAGSKEGLGLGLYIVHGLVEAHGGRIWVECAGDTTTFRFTLPVAA